MSQSDAPSAPVTDGLTPLEKDLLESWRQRSRDCRQFSEEHESEFSEGKAAAYWRCADELLHAIVTGKLPPSIAKAVKP